MTRRMNGAPSPAVGAKAPQAGQAKAAAGKTAKARSRCDRLVEVIDHLTVAKQFSDESGEKLLSYLLSMAIQEARLAMRSETSAGESSQ